MISLFNMVFGPGVTIFTIILIFLLGIMIGSFLNVCIYRLPLGQEIAIQRSHCMSCGHVLKWYELIPLFSWLIQGGKCRACKAKISKQYPIVEATNGLLWMGVLAARNFFLGEVEWTTSALAAVLTDTALFCICTSVMLVITVIDERTQEIPIGLNISIAILGGIRLILSIVLGRGIWLELLIGAFAVSGLFFLIVLISKGKWLGMGDVKLMAAAGLLLGWKHIFLALALGSILGSVIHLFRMKISRKKDHVLALGPYLCLGIYLTILFGEPILKWYLGVLGF